MTDRSFWFDARVVAASRRFVCARLLSFESESERALLARICIDPITRRVENTAFAVLTPDGKTFLVPGQRYPSGAASDAEELSELLVKIADRYASTKKPATPAQQGLPGVIDLRRAVNVAACDDQPLVVISARDAGRRAALAAAVRTLAWDARFVGRMQFVVESDPAKLKRLGAAGAEGVLVAKSETYGRTATVLARAGVDATPEVLAATLAKGLKAFRPRGEIDGEAHVRVGREQEIDWQPAAPRKTK